MPTVKAQRVIGLHEVETGPDGCFSFTRLYSDPDIVAGMQYKCPCGCGHVNYIEFEREDSIPPHWKWDGNYNKPTLEPSIYSFSLPCKWHGWLADGEWIKVK